MKKLATLLTPLLMIALVVSASSCTKQEAPIPVTACSADFIVEPIPGNCRVQGERLSCKETAIVHFVDKSTGNVTGWAWDFDNDGVIDSTIKNPTYTYSRSGNYTITINITTENCQDRLTKQDYISISVCHT